jgi:hypothetical protein
MAQPTVGRLCACDRDASRVVPVAPCPSCMMEEGVEGSDGGSRTPSECGSHGDFTLCERSAFGLRLCSRLGESWIVTPPPCFTGTDSVKGELEPNPMENLLIERPSLDLRGLSPRLQHLLAERQRSPAVEEWLERVPRTQPLEEEEPSQRDNSQEQPSPAARRDAVVRVISSNRLLVAVAPKDSPLVRASQRDQLKFKSWPLSRRNIERSNRVMMVQSSGRKHVAQRNRVLRPSGCMASRHTQRH